MFFSHGRVKNKPGALKSSKIPIDSLREGLALSIHSPIGPILEGFLDIDSLMGSMLKGFLNILGPMESILKGYACPHGVDMDRLSVGGQSVPNRVNIEGLCLLSWS